MEDKAAKPAEKPPGVIVRLGSFLISHSTIVSFLCFFAGFVALLLLPVLAKNTYISENALMPGSANPIYGARDAAEANKLVRDLLTLQEVSGDLTREIPVLITERMQDVGAEAYYHSFPSQVNQLHPVHFFSGTHYSLHRKENATCDSSGLNLVGILRAPRGDGKEAIVLVTPYNSTDIKRSEILSLGLAYSIFSLLSRVTWLAKDVVWLAADLKYGEFNAVASWLRDYHNPTFQSESATLNIQTCIPIKGEPGIFKRAGTMAAALVLKVTEREKRINRDAVKIYAEASNGQMPNLDLINIVNYLAVHRQGLRVEVASASFLRNSMWLRSLGEVLQWINRVASSLNPQWNLGISSSEYVEGTATLASSIYYQALGVPTGSHGAFRDYQVDAITLEMSPEVSLNKDIGQVGFLLKGGRLFEGVIRSVNNLLEKFHQSFFLYLLTSPGKFVSVGVYMISFVLLVIPLPVVAVALYTHSNKAGNYAKEDTKSNSGFAELQLQLESWRWLHAAKFVFVVHVWATIVSLLPYFLYKMPITTSTAYLVAWLLLSIFTLLILRLVFGSPYISSKHSSTKKFQITDWTILKSGAIAATSIGLCLMSIINFATTQIGAILVVLMRLIIHPLKHMGRSIILKAVPLVALNLMMIMVGFPPAFLLLLRGLCMGLSEANVGDFWEWTESLWALNSASYLYLTLVHLPCWLLCTIILLHPL